MELELDVDACERCDHVHLTIREGGKQIFSVALSEETWSALWASHTLARAVICKRNGQGEKIN